MSINSVTLSGNVGADVNVKQLPSGDLVANFSVATNSYYTDKAGNSQKETEWHKIVCYGRNAKVARDYLKPGSKITLLGNLKTRSWDHQDGYKVYVTEVRVERLDIHDPRPKTNGNASNNSNNPQYPTVAPGDIDDDLPF